MEPHGTPRECVTSITAQAPTLLAGLGRVKGAWYLVGVSVGTVYRNLCKANTSLSPGKVTGKHSAPAVREVFETGEFTQSITKPVNQQIVALSLSMWVTLTLSALLTSLGRAGP